MRAHETITIRWEKRGEVCTMLLNLGRTLSQSYQVRNALCAAGLYGGAKEASFIGVSLPTWNEGSAQQLDRRGIISSGETSSQLEPLLLTSTVHLFSNSSRCSDSKLRRLR